MMPHLRAFVHFLVNYSLSVQFLMLKLIYEFNRLAGIAIENYADLDDILSASCKEMIGRSKYITEEELFKFDDIFKTMNTELKAITEGGNDDV